MIGIGVGGSLLRPQVTYTWHHCVCYVSQDLASSIYFLQPTSKQGMLLDGNAIFSSIV